jgi:heterotetrameric sarcosine oxidase gamma subunit
MVSQRKGDFVGRRSHRRVDTEREDRKQLVGLLPAERLPEGAQLVVDPDVPVPVPMAGFVTSSYDSAALGRPFALALLERGRDRTGETVFAPLEDRVVAAEVVEPVFVDPEGSRRDGDGRDQVAPPAAAAPRGAAPPARAPLAALADAFAAASCEAVGIVEQPFPAQVGVRLHPGPGGPSAVEAALGFPLPAAPNTTASDTHRTALWLGPDEWLVVAAPDAQAALELELAEALGDGLGSVVDLSANRAAIELRGPAARDVLAKGCALDLHPRAFGPGRCAQTLVARTQVILEQQRDDAYRLLVRPSFSAYLAAWLLDAAAEFQPDSSRRMASLRQRSVRATSLNV